MVGFISIISMRLLRYLAKSCRWTKEFTQSLAARGVPDILLILLRLVSLLWEMWLLSLLSLMGWKDEASVKVW